MTSPLREHIEYVSDSRRLALYREAVGLLVSPGDTVADLGCGFGVLGLLCLQAGASRAWGIDRTDAIEIARETMDRAGLGDRYSCIRESSFRASLPEPVDVLICDHVGYFGIDYGIVGMVEDARRRMLKPGGQVLPRRIRTVLSGVSSPEARGQAQAWRQPGVPPEYGWLHEYAVNTGYNRQFRAGEIATDAVAAGTIDLCVDNPALLRFEAELAMQRDGELDGLAGWFEAELADDVWMTNSPLDARCIQRDQLFLPIDPPAPLKAGDRVKVEVSVRHDDALVGWKVTAASSGYRTRHSSWNSVILSEADRQMPATCVPRLSATGRARGIVLAYVDGKRTQSEIEQLVLRDHPDLFPSEEEIRRFVGGELKAGTLP